MKLKSALLATAFAFTALSTLPALAHVEWDNGHRAFHDELGELVPSRASPITRLLRVDVGPVTTPRLSRKIAFRRQAMAPLSYSHGRNEGDCRQHRRTLSESYSTDCCTCV